ncbi:MAG: flagellar motor switch phosphatase FliY [Thermacetogeniaceae bacterium]
MEGQVLTQEELNLLLEGVSSDGVNGVNGVNADMSEIEDFTLSLSGRETLVRIVDISMKKSAESLSQLIKRPVRSNIPIISETTWDRIVKEGIISSERIVTKVSFIEGLQHDNLLVIKVKDAEVIVDLMMGGKGRVITGELDELRMSAVGEAMNQMMGTSATALADIFDKKVIISTPTIKIVNDEKQLFSSYRNEKIILVRIAFSMDLDENVQTEICQVIPITNALEMIKRAKNEATLIPDQAPEPLKPLKTAREHTEKTVAAQPVQFLPLETSVTMKNDPVRQAEYNKLELIYDVPLQFTVELGRTEKSLKEILELGPGSVIGLEKLAGESLDILVNGKYIAKGEVIVIDENYGVRIKEILNCEERFGSIKTRG